jgi:hypothetical protein
MMRITQHDDGYYLGVAISLRALLEAEDGGEGGRRIDDKHTQGNIGQAC